MNTFIALTFIGILTSAYAETRVKVQKCKQEKPMEGFDAKEFFISTWYVSHVKDKTSASVCQTFTTSKQDGKYKVEYKYNKEEQENEVSCEATDQRGSPKLTFSCKSGGSTFQSELTILDTDYYDYAVFYKCDTLTSSSKEDNYFASDRSGGGGSFSGAALLIHNLELIKCKE